MAGLELGRQIEARGADLMAPADLGLAIFPDRAVQPVADRTAEQRMVGRVELDDIDAPALPVVGLQLRRLGVGEARQVLRLLGQHEAPERVEILANRCGEILGDLDQQRVAAPGIGTVEQRRLVGYLVRHACPSSATNPQPWQNLIAEGERQARRKSRGEAMLSNGSSCDAPAASL